MNNALLIFSIFTYFQYLYINPKRHGDILVGRGMRILILPYMILWWFFSKMEKLFPYFVRMLLLQKIISKHEEELLITWVGVSIIFCILLLLLGCQSHDRWNLWYHFSAKIEHLALKSSVKIEHMGRSNLRKNFQDRHCFGLVNCKGRSRNIFCIWRDFYN